MNAEFQWTHFLCIFFAFIFIFYADSSGATLIILRFLLSLILHSLKGYPSRVIPLSGAYGSFRWHIMDYNGFDQANGLEFLDVISGFGGSPQWNQWKLFILLLMILVSDSLEDLSF